MPERYCTVDDVRRALRSADLPGDVAQDVQILTDAIAAQTEWFEKTFKRHWYEPDASSNLLPTGPKTRDDEHDLPTHGGLVHGESEHERHRYRENSDALLEADPRHEHRREHRRDPKREIRIATGEYHHHHETAAPAYTRITLDRRDVQALNQLLVIGADGSYTDWVGSDDYSGGMWPDALGEDYYVRINNSGVSELYIDVHALDDDIASLSNAVYVDIDYGHEGIPKTARRGIAFRAAADLAEDAAIQIPENAQVYNVETLAEQFERKAEELLEAYR